jgi:hypothetical protein
VFAANRHNIQGLAAQPDGAFWFADGSAHVYRTTDFETVETVFRGARPFTDVAVEPDRTAAAP